MEILRLAAILAALFMVGFLILVMANSERGASGGSEYYGSDGIPSKSDNYIDTGGRLVNPYDQIR